MGCGGSKPMQSVGAAAETVADKLNPLTLFEAKGDASSRYGRDGYWLPRRIGPLSRSHGCNNGA